MDRSGAAAVRGAHPVAGGGVPGGGVPDGGGADGGGADGYTAQEGGAVAPGAWQAEGQDPYCLPDEEADRLLAGARWRRLAVLGDGLAQGLGEPVPGYRPVPWADRVRDALARRVPNLAYRNLGRADLLAADVRARQLEPALEFGPDLAAVVCGGNDLLSERFDARGTEAEIEAVVKALRAEGADVVLVTLMDICAGVPELSALRPHMAAFNEILRDVSWRHETVLVDLWGHPVCAAQDSYSRDLIHPSMRGHAVLAAQVLRRLGDRLAA